MKRILWSLGLVGMLAGVALAIGTSSGRGTFAQRPTCRPNRFGKVYTVTNCGSLSCAVGGGTVECEQVCTDGSPDAWVSFFCVAANGVATLNPTSTTTTTVTTTSTTTSTST